MNKLSIFDDNVRIATITIINNRPYIFARSVREWLDVDRWINQGFYYLNKDKDEYIKIEPKDKTFFALLAEKAQSYDFNTELKNKE